MKSILKIIEYIYPLTGIDWLDSILFVIIGVASFSISFFIVGLFSCKDRETMSKAHWGLRFFLTIVFMTAIKEGVDFCKTLPWWGWLIFGVVVASIVFLVVYLYIRSIIKEDS